MADLTVTAASVLAGVDAKIEYGTAGATITAGQVVYKEAATALFKLADCDSGTAEVRVPYGIALVGSLNGQPIAVQRSGSITTGATMTGGLAYYLSKTAGGICPVADIATGGYPALLGLTSSTTVLQLNIQTSGVAQ